MAGTESGDPISNSVINEKASRFVRLMLKAAFQNKAAGLSPEYLDEAQVLFANIVMNDILNWWNTDLTESANDAKNYADGVISASAAPPASVLALAYHARGMANRALNNPNGALADFQSAVSQDQNFARAYAQLGNQKTLNGLTDPTKDNPHGDFKSARSLGPDHPAAGYFEWGEGRLYFIEAISKSQPWSQAVSCLQKSVNKSPALWYNYLYLAAAQDADGRKFGAKQTICDFMNYFTQLGKDPKAMLKQACVLLNVQNPTDPLGEARKKVHDFLQAQGVC